MIDYDSFKAEFDACGYPIGNPTTTYNSICFHVEKMSMEDGSPITYEIIMTKFKEHLDLWNYLYRKKEEDGYLSKEAEKKRKCLQDFVEDKLYNQQFTISKTNTIRDKYLFGPFNIKYLMDKLKEFEERFKKK